MSKINRFVFMDMDNIVRALFENQTIHERVYGATKPSDLQVNWHNLTKKLFREDNIKQLFAYYFDTPLAIVKSLENVIIDHYPCWTVKKQPDFSDTSLQLALYRNIDMVSNNDYKNMLVFVSGDKKRSVKKSRILEGNLFVPIITSYLNSGWLVEIHSWEHSLSTAYRTLEDKYPDQLRVMILDDENVSEIVRTRRKKNQSMEENAEENKEEKEENISSVSLKHNSQNINHFNSNEEFMMKKVSQFLIIEFKEFQKEFQKRIDLIFDKENILYSDSLDGFNIYSILIQAQDQNDTNSTLCPKKFNQLLISRNLVLSHKAIIELEKWRNCFDKNALLLLKKDLLEMKTKWKTIILPIIAKNLHACLVKFKEHIIIDSKIKYYEGQIGEYIDKVDNIDTQINFLKENLNI